MNHERLPSRAGRRPALRVAITAVLLVTLAGGGSVTGCDTFNEQNEFADAAWEEPPAGITRTDEDGEVLQRDEDDWRTAPLYQGAIDFDPAYPNPTAGRRRVTLPFLVTDFNSISGSLILRGFDNRGNFVSLDEVRDAGQTGFHTFSFPASLLSTSGDLSSIEGLHRLFVLDARGELVTYGDLRVDLSADTTAAE